jgi:hypothetical protein
VSFQITDTSTPESRFTDRFEKFVEHGYSPSPKEPNWHWNPRGGVWYFYAPTLYNFSDQNLPSVTVPDLVVDRGASIYGTITQQYATLSTEQKNSVVWHSRMHKWMVMSSVKAPDTDERRKAREEWKRKLALLGAQLESGEIKTQDLYEKLVADLWEQYQHRV